MRISQKTVVVNNFWDASVTLPVGPTTGDIYICSASGNGWLDDYMYRYNGTTWDDYEPFIGNHISNIADTYAYRYNGTDWVQFGGSGAAGSGCLWTQDANGIYRQSKVTIGQSWCDNEHLLTLSTALLSSSIYMENGNFGAMKIRCSDIWNAIDYDPVNDGNGLAFDSYNTRMVTFNNDGKVGIGLETPANALLHIRRGIGAGGGASMGDANTLVEYESNTNATNFWFRIPPVISGGNNASIGFATGTTPHHGICYNAPNDRLVLTNNSWSGNPTDGVIVDAGSQVGINHVPNYNFHVHNEIGVGSTLAIRDVNGTNTIEFGDFDGCGRDVVISADNTNIRLDVLGTEVAKFSSNAIRFHNNYNFPITDGLSGQTFITDGNGHIDWGSPSGGGGTSLWTQSGASCIHPTNTSHYVGIGAAGNMPNRPLSIFGTGGYAGAVYLNGTAPRLEWHMPSNPSGRQCWDLVPYTNAMHLRSLTDDFSAIKYGYLHLFDDGVDVYTEINETNADMDFIVNANGQPNLIYADAGSNMVGIGDGTPVALLDIDGGLTPLAGVGTKLVVNGWVEYQGAAIGPNAAGQYWRNTTTGKAWQLFQRSNTGIPNDGLIFSHFDGTTWQTNTLELGLNGNVKMPIAGGSLMVSSSIITYDKIRINDGANYNEFDSSGLTTSTTYTLPVSDGTGGQVLTTDGVGYLSWKGTKSVDAWVSGESFTRNADDRFTVANTSLNQEVFKKGRPIKYRQTAGTWRYALVSNYATGSVWIAGHPMTTSDDDELYYSFMNMGQVLSFAINGTFADGNNNNLLEDDLNTYFRWELGDAYLAKISHIITTNDTSGSTYNPYVNTSIGDKSTTMNKVCTSNIGKGRQTSNNWVNTDVDISSGSYKINYGDDIEITTNYHPSSIRDASNLTVQMYFVLEN